MIDLGVLSGSDESFAYGINSSGQIVGETYTSSTNIRRPFRWTEAKGMEDIGALTGDPAAGAYSINDDGLIVGYSATAAYRSGPVRAIQWTAAGAKTQISDCSGLPCYAAANAINKSGQVVGTRLNGVFIWTAAGGPADLGGLPGAQFSEAFSLNDAGQVVGYSLIGLSYRSFLWTSSAGFVDIGLLPGKTWSVATAINNLGQIVGYGQ
jgi:probable HAF family extracellular repeat protein